MLRVPIELKLDAPEPALEVRSGFARPSRRNTNRDYCATPKAIRRRAWKRLARVVWHRWCA